jgi:hypothetical protein
MRSPAPASVVPRTRTSEHDFKFGRCDPVLRPCNSVADARPAVEAALRAVGLLK